MKNETYSFIEIYSIVITSKNYGDIWKYKITGEEIPECYYSWNFHVVENPTNKSLGAEFEKIVREIKSGAVEGILGVRIIDEKGGVLKLFTPQPKI